MKIPEPINTTANAIDTFHASHQGKPRPHMGASMLGHKCERWLWLSFRLAVIPSFSGRMLRLFRRGEREEDLIVEDLRHAGLDVKNRQAKIDFGCHVAGSIDGEVIGVPEAPTKPHLLECKTHNDASFKDLVKNGVEKSKPQHYAQMQVYMLGRNLERTLYCAVNKNDDTLHTERVRFDEEVAIKFVKRGQRIALEERIPAPISTDPSWYECKMCDGYDFCHKSKTTKEVNCRTCAHSTPKADSTWHCEKYDVALNFDNQVTGCVGHTLHPDLVPWKYTPSENGVVWHTPLGDIENGENAYHSSEIVTNLEACFDSKVNELREVFGGRVVE